MIYRFVKFHIVYRYDYHLEAYDTYSYELLVEHYDLMALVSGGERAQENYLRMRFGDSELVITHVEMECDTSVEFDKYGEGPYVVTEKYVNFSTLFERVKAKQKQIWEEESRRSKIQSEKEEKKKREEDRRARERYELNKFLEEEKAGRARNRWAYLHQNDGKTQNNKKDKTTKEKAESVFNSFDRGMCMLTRCFLWFVAFLFIMVAFVAKSGFIPSLIFIIISIVILIWWLNQKPENEVFPFFHNHNKKETKEVYIQKNTNTENNGLKKVIAIVYVVGLIISFLVFILSHLHFWEAVVGSLAWPIILIIMLARY